MKKIFLSAASLSLAAALLLPLPALAITQEEAAENWEKWSLSAKPKPTEEEQAAEREKLRWTLIMENEVGVYAYDASALAVIAPHRVAALVKTVFTDKAILKKLNNDHKAKLKKREKVIACQLEMIFDLESRTYSVTNTRIFSDGDRLLDEKRGTGKFSAVPPQSFAEAMSEIAQEFYAGKTSTPKADKEAGQ